MLEITSGGRAGAGQDQELTEFLDFEDGSNVQGGAQQQQQQSGAGTVGQESTEEPRRPQEPEIERASQVDTAAATATEDKQIKHLPDFIDRLQTLCCKSADMGGKLKKKVVKFTLIPDSNL